MINAYRKLFNENFSEEKYRKFLGLLQEEYAAPSIRFAETPVFIPAALRERLIDAGKEIIALIKQPDFRAITEQAIPKGWKVPNEGSHPHFLAFDFGICQGDDGELLPKLIELQAFPSLFGLQLQLANSYRSAFQLDEYAALTPFFYGIDEDEYLNLLKKVILGSCAPEEVALMDIDAPYQKTAIDFYITSRHLGIPVLSFTDIIKEGRQLFYQSGERKIQLKRIYNRVIFDEIKDKPELLNENFDPREDLDIEWITHPNWFYRVSKFTLPFLKGDFVPETQFLDKIEAIPNDLENYVLKPLFSYAGKGVKIDVTEEDIFPITDPENWILQKKVAYLPVIDSPQGMVKTEIRLLYIWPEGEEPQLCINLARLSKGKMIGVSHNHDDGWTGGTVGLMDL